MSFKPRSESAVKRLSQWETMMRKYSENYAKQCKMISLDIPRAMRSNKHFPTGSEYEGTWDVLGMSGYGTYKFPNGVIYEGHFEDGMFHGDGALRYPSGDVLKGNWKKGVLTDTDKTLIFSDGLEYKEDNWKYCRGSDRRLSIEYINGLQPAKEEYKTAEQPTRDIPPGYYDTGDGFYDPTTKIVYCADNIAAIVRKPSEREQKWIIENCRQTPLPHLGPRKDLYEEWLEQQLTLPRSIPLDPSMQSSRATSYQYESERDSAVEKLLCYFRRSSVNQRITFVTPSPE